MDVNGLSTELKTLSLYLIAVFCSLCRCFSFSKLEECHQNSVAMKGVLNLWSSVQDILDTMDVRILREWFGGVIFAAGRTSPATRNTDTLMFWSDNDDQYINMHLVLPVCSWLSEANSRAYDSLATLG